MTDNLVKPFLCACALMLYIAFGIGLAAAWNEAKACAEHEAAPAHSGFNPFAWREAGVQAVTRATGNPGSDHARQHSFERNGVAWTIRESDKDRLWDQASGRVGDWRVWLRWDISMGEPIGWASVLSDPPDAAQRLELTLRCSAVDDEHKDWANGWTVGVRWNWDLYGEPSSEEWSEFNQSEAMRAGGYRMRVDRSEVRKVQAEAKDPRGEWFGGSSEARIVGEGDASWLEQHVRAGARMKIATLRWSKYQRKWIEQEQHGEFSLKGSSRAMALIQEHCRRPPR